MDAITKMEPRGSIFAASTRWNAPGDASSSPEVPTASDAGPTNFWLEVKAQPEANDEAKCKQNGSKTSGGWEVVDSYNITRLPR